MAMYVYSIDGDPVGFVFETSIYDLGGNPLGRLVGSRVHRFDGSYVGEWFKDMVVRRPQGRRDAGVLHRRVPQPVHEQCVQTSLPYCLQPMPQCRC